MAPIRIIELVTIQTRGRNDIIEIALNLSSDLFQKIQLVPTKKPLERNQKVLKVIINLVGLQYVYNQNTFHIVFSVITLTVSVQTRLLKATFNSAYMTLAT